MKKIAIWSFFIILFSQQSYALNGSIENNRYYSPHRTFSVEKPNIVSLNIKEGTDGPLQNVTFVTGHRFWMIDGSYQVDFFNIPKVKRKQTGIPDETLIKYISKTMQAGIQSGEVGKVIKSSGPQCRFIKVNAKKAYQCVYSFESQLAQLIKTSKPPIKGLFVGTSIFFNEGWIQAFGIESIENRKFNWARYNKMLNSIKING